MRLALVATHSADSMSRPAGFFAPPRSPGPGLIDAAIATLVEASADASPPRRRARRRPGSRSTAGRRGAAVADADLVVEAVVEDVAVKRRVFAAIDAHAPAGGR
jgi:3-hydroxyacyl-CoA dehydrogenase